MTVITSSSLANDAPIAATEATDDNGRPVNPLCEAHSSVVKASNDDQIMMLPPFSYYPPQIARPRKQRKTGVSRQLWPAAKSASNMSIHKEQAASKTPVSLPEVNISIQAIRIKPPNQAQDIVAIGSVPNADKNNAQQALASDPTSGSSNSSNSKTERFVLTPSPSPDTDSLRGPSGFRTPAKAITYNMSEPPHLVRGKKRSRSDGEEMSPTERHRLGKHRMRAFF